MALDPNQSISSLLGPSAKTEVDGSKITLTLDANELSIANPASLTSEGFLLAILLKLANSQNGSNARVMEVTRDPQIVSTRSNTSVRGERFTVKIFSAVPLAPIDPNDV